MNAARTMTTHRAIQVSALLDVAQSKARTFRICAGKAVEIGNRGACGHFINRAQRCDSISMRCYLLLGRDHIARMNAANAQP